MRNTSLVSPMDTFSQPFKKPRLDSMVDIQLPHCSKYVPSSGVGGEDNQDDFWGPDDFTAEEFDMLQSQVDSQVINQEPGKIQMSQEMDQRLEKREIVGSQNNSTSQENQLSQLQEQQFAQEGHIKMLKASLATTSKELDRERLLREELIQQRMQEYKTQETKFQKQLHQLQTELQFKEQEIRAAHEKMISLEQKVKENTLSVENNNVYNKNISPKVSPRKISPNKFINRFSFPNGCQKFPSMTEVAVQTERSTKSITSRNVHLNVSCSKGVTTGSVLVSKMLCNRMSCLCLWDSSRTRATQRIGPPLFLSGFGFPEVSLADQEFTVIRLGLAKLNMVQCLGTSCEVLFPQVESCLHQYLKSLHVLASQGKALSPSLTWSHATSGTRDGSTSSPDTTFHGLQSQAASALCDLVKFLSLRSAESSCDVGKERKDLCNCKTSPKLPEMKTAIPLDLDSEVCDNNDSVCHLASLLVTLSNPLFSGNDCVNQIVVHWSLMALLMLSSHSQFKLEPYLPQLNLRDFVSGICGLEASYLVLQLIHRLLPLNSPGILLHSCTEPCVFNSLAQLCQQVHSQLRLQQATEMVIMVINFLSQIMACHGISVLCDGQCGCSAECNVSSSLLVATV